MMKKKNVVKKRGGGMMKKRGGGIVKKRGGGMINKMRVGGTAGANPHKARRGM